MSSDARTINLLGALALAVTDRMRDATEHAAGRQAAGPAALVALHGFLDRGSMDQLRGVVGLTASGAVRLVDRLQADGYVSRHPGPDGRSVALSLTAAGRRVARRVLIARAAALDDAVAQLSDDERAALAGLAEKILQTITVDRLAQREAGHEPAGGWLCRMCDLSACGREIGTCPTANAVRQTYA